MGKNKLSIYMIKEGVDEKDIIKKYENYGFVNDYKKREIDHNKTIYYNISKSSSPKWIKSFFCDKVLLNDIFSSNAKLVLLVKIIENVNKVRYFALTMGYGRSLLVDNAIEESFGLKVVLNCAKQNEIRKICKINIGGNQSSGNEQLPIKGNISDFGFDIDRDIVSSITCGLKSDEWFCNNATGADILSISAEANINNIENLLNYCLEKYNCSDYKEDFSWIDNIKSIKNKKEIEFLDKLLISNLNSDNINFYTAVPEVIDWVNLKGFKIPGMKKIFDDIIIDDVLKSFKKELIQVEQLKNKCIVAIDLSNEETMGQWSAYKCLYGEIEVNEKTYCLNFGKWYCINKEFKNEIEIDYANTVLCEGIDFFDCKKGENEGDYNKRLASTNKNYLCMVAKSIAYGGGHSKIELCDILTSDKKLIHIKAYHGSAPLSHLFNQGVVSLELLLDDEKFIIKANEKIKENTKDPIFSLEKTPNYTYTVIFGIIIEYDDSLPRIPFFSKVAFRYVKRRINLMGANVEMARIKRLV